jgi:hypothetical protein
MSFFAMRAIGVKMTFTGEGDLSGATMTVWVPISFAGAESNAEDGDLDVAVAIARKCLDRPVTPAEGWEVIGLSMDPTEAVALPLDVEDEGG